MPSTTHRSNGERKAVSLKKPGVAQLEEHETVMVTRLEPPWVCRSQGRWFESGSPDSIFAIFDLPSSSFILSTSGHVNEAFLSLHIYFLGRAADLFNHLQDEFQRIVHPYIDTSESKNHSRPSFNTSNKKEEETTWASQTTETQQCENLCFQSPAEERQ
jgi:hypothetical protein